jgi:hypothetical protein
MLPLHLTGVVNILVTLIIGFWFGFVLEQAGFGDCRNLAAQFYLSDLRVFKVMFSAIVTAMLLLFAASAVGIVDFDQIFVPPTYIGASIAGGLALGTGFIIGGYCPGTSLVSLATFKLDGLAFVLGVSAGLFVFGLMSPNLVEFWTTTGAMGQITIFEWLGIDAGPVVLTVLMMAVGSFYLGEWAERRFTWAKPPVPTTANSLRWLQIVTTGGFVLAGVAFVVGQPDVERKIAMNQSRLDEAIQSRRVFIDPAELLNLLHNNQVDRVLLDVRSEADYNLFHIKDAIHTTIAEIDRVWRKKLSPEQVVVVMSNDETAAIEAWKHLAVSRGINAYILAGGVNRWCEIYLAENFNAPGPEFKSEGNDRFRYANLLIGHRPCPLQQTPIALQVPATKGDSVPAARPKQELLSVRSFQPKIRLMKAAKAPGGGCGG